MPVAVRLHTAIPNAGGPWEFRDNIATLTSVADLAFETPCSGDSVFYEELHEDRSRSSLLLQAPEGCYRDEVGTWFHWGPSVVWQEPRQE